MSESAKLTGRQIAAGRTLAGISQSDLAASARISVPTLRRMEASEGEAAGMTNNVEAVRRALDAAGVIFVAENGEGAGVRLRKQQATEGEEFDPAPNGVQTQVGEPRKPKPR